MGKGGRVRVKQIGGGGGAKMPINPLADLMGGIPKDEMIQLPPKRDSNSGFMIWPMNETFTMQFKTFSAIYPNYLDSDKTVKLGRRIATKDAVPEPTIQDIHEALALLEVRHVIQPHKGYSRDASSQWDNPGRIMVDLEGAIQNGIFGKSADGAYDLDTLPDMGDDENCGNQNTANGEGREKKQFLRRLALVISGLPNRQKRLEVKSKLLEEERLKAAKEEEKVVVKPGVIRNGTSGNRKKKGKNKK